MAKFGRFFYSVKQKKSQRRSARPEAGEGKGRERKGKEGFLKDKEGLDNSGDRDGIRGALVNQAAYRGRQRTQECCPAAIEVMHAKRAKHRK